MVQWPIRYVHIPQGLVKNFFKKLNKKIANFGLTIACWVIFHTLLIMLSADFFFKLTFSKSSFRNTIRVLDSLDSDQDLHSVGPDLGPNCLQR